MAKAIFAGDFRHDLGSIVDPAECAFNEQEIRCLLKLRKEFADADAWIIGLILNNREAFAGATLVYDYDQGGCVKQTTLISGSRIPFHWFNQPASTDEANANAR